MSTVIDSEMVELSGTVAAITRHTTRHNETYAIVDLRVQDGVETVLYFPVPYQKSSDILAQPAPVTIKARYDERNGQYVAIETRSAA
jgi:hypothetical protein